MSTTLIIGLVGTGKTTYAKENRNDALVYDLDYLKASLTYSDVHDEDDECARKVANAFLETFIAEGRAFNRDLLIIRMAPKITELSSIKPDKVVVMLKQYDVSPRADSHEIDIDLYEARISACIKWCDRNGIPIEYKE